MDKREEIKTGVSSVFDSFIPSENTAPKQDKTPKQDKKTDNLKNGIAKGVDKAINGYKYKNGKNKSDNFITTFKIDADIEHYLQNIEKILFIDALNNGKTQSMTATDYINNLIRTDLKKRFNISDKETDSNKWIKAYKDYRKKYQNILDSEK